MVLMKEHTQRSMEQKQESRDRSTQILSTDFFFYKGTNEFNGERSFFNIQQNMNPDTDLTPLPKN